MTRDELAKTLDGREYPFKLTKEERETAKATGLMVVYGASDDLIEMDGCVREEMGAFGGGKFRIGRNGFLPEPRRFFEDLANDCADDKDAIRSAQSFLDRYNGSYEILAIWGRDDIDWQYTTMLDHSTFRIMEDGRVYCIGIVIDWNNPFDELF